MTDSRVIQAYSHYSGVWPYKELPSGVMFWLGLRITLEDFIALGNTRRGPNVHSGNEHLFRD